MPGESELLPGDQLAIEKMPGHWLLARMGKRVLRPGGLELTERLLASLGISAQDHVVELAPGLGATARLVLQRTPASYTGIERDAAAAASVKPVLRGAQDRCVVGRAEDTGLGAEEATVIFGEAMLSMQSHGHKRRIVEEAFRVLKPGGRYGIHELGLRPDDIDASFKDDIQGTLTAAIRVGVRPLTLSEWISTLEDAGFEVDPEQVTESAMHLLEPLRLVADEGILGALRIAARVLSNPAARRRVAQMRTGFRRYRDSLCAYAIVATKPITAPGQVDGTRNGDVAR